MSESPDIGLDLEDLELQLLPAWARQSPDANRYAKYEGGEGASGPRERERRERRGKRPDQPGRRQSGAGSPERQRRPRADGAGPARRERGGRFDGPRREERREADAPLPEISVNLVPEEKGVESLARQIKLTGRAYPIFDIAHLILKRPDRYRATFSVPKKSDNLIAQPLWVCNLDDTLWLSDQDAVNHVLRKHFDTFYKTERTPTDPPKGTYTFVAQCSLSGIVLGPPNYHDYQNKLRKLHAERFSGMPFEVYKAKVKIVKDEAVVKKWSEEQSWKTEYSCLNVPEAKRLGSRDEAEGHFRAVHSGNIIRAVESYALPGAAAQQLPAPALRQLLRRAWDEQQRFPLQVVTALSRQFAAQGLQFFKVNKTVTHVAVARPHYLDAEATPVSEGIQRIVDFINAHPRCTRRQLLEALAPWPAPPAVPGAPPVADESVATGTPAVAPAAPAEKSEPTSEQTAVIADLHWLIHQGHVIEFANGRIETTRKPVPKPPRPERKTAEAGGEPAGASDEIPAGASAVLNAGPTSQTEAPSQAVTAAPETGPQSAAPDEMAGLAPREGRLGTVGPPPAPDNQSTPATIPAGSA